MISSDAQSGFGAGLLGRDKNQRFVAEQPVALWAFQSAMPLVQRKQL